MRSSRVIRASLACAALALASSPNFAAADTFERIDPASIERAAPQARNSGFPPAGDRVAASPQRPWGTRSVEPGQFESAAVELLVNGNFETGTFLGWSPLAQAGSGGALILSTPGAALPASGLPTSPNPGGGARYAVTDMVGPGAYALSQSFTVPADALRVFLSFEMFVDDWGGTGGIVHPAGLDFTAAPNQHSRIDILSAGAPPFDTGAFVVANFYLGVDPAPPNPYVGYAFEITGLVTPGASYVLRFGTVDNVSFLHQGVDNVSIRALVPACGDLVIDAPFETCDPPGNQGCDCCTDTPALGCSNPDCTAQVCTIDPTCCTVDWDASCATLALAIPACAACCDADCRGDCTYCSDGAIQAPEACDPPGARAPLANVAIFQDQAPWGTTANEDTLLANGVPFVFFTTADMGVVNLAPFDKVVIASQQTPAFYAALSANAAWFDAYVLAGGILEFHGASFFGDDWSALPMPAALTIAPQGGGAEDDALTVAAPGHPLVTTPNPINDAQIDGWGSSTHSFFTGAGAPFTTVIREDEFGQPTLIEFPLGGGCVIATMMTMEFAGPAAAPLLENSLLRDCRAAGPVCRNDCHYCGDGTTENPVEQCDDGNNLDGDGCSAICTIETGCGNGLLDPGESCDPPGSPACNCCSASGTPGCSNSGCQAAVCAIDSFCCSVQWDSICAGEAQNELVCAACCANFCRGDCTYCGDGVLNGGAALTLIRNNNFESGILAPWIATDLAPSAGSFLIDLPGTTAPLSANPTAPNPGGGRYYAVADQTSASTNALAQSFTVPPGTVQVGLSFEMFVNDWSGSGGIVDPSGLNHIGPPNQHARVDLMSPGFPPFDTGAGVVANLYLGVDPGASPHPYTPYAFDITGIALPGASFDLRFAETGNQFFLTQGVDNVRVAATMQDEACDPSGLVGPPPCNCCVPGLGPGCSDAACTAAVCGLDPFCCNTQWDATCANEALTVVMCGCCDPSSCTAVCRLCPDFDQDGICDADDNCPLTSNPGGGVAAFGQTIYAPNKFAFSWSLPANADWVRGSVAALPGYGILAFNTASNTTSIPAPELPFPGSAFYWLVRPDCPLTSWTSGGSGECNPPGVCPPGGRDGNLPPP